MQFTTDTVLYRVIGSNIKYYREQSRLTQPQLAEAAKISIRYLSKIEASGCDKSTFNPPSLYIHGWIRTFINDKQEIGQVVYLICRNTPPYCSISEIYFPENSVVLSFILYIFTL